jgi:hypothetical protein
LEHLEPSISGPVKVSPVGITLDSGGGASRGEITMESSRIEE